MKNRLISFTVALTLATIGCEGPEGPIGLKSLVKITNVPPGANCVNGGLKIETGIDNNKNDVLEENEIDNTQYVCNGGNGQNGYKSLILMTPETPGTNCQAGGYRIDSGLDANANNLLDVNEIQATSYICNGQNGLNSLVTVTTEPAGNNCSAGGYKIESGLDTNKNNLLDTGEILSIRYVCNGSYDKVTILGFGYGNGTTSTAWTLSPHSLSLDLVNFNIGNYTGADSVVFVAFLGTHQSGNKCFVELFNKTDNLSINNSLLISDQLVSSGNPQPYQLRQTGNILKDLPKKEITLSYRIRSEAQGVLVSTAAGTCCYLYIYKK